MENRTYILHARITESERNQLSELAEQQGRTLSELTRQALTALVTKPEIEQENYEEVER